MNSSFLESEDAAISANRTFTYLMVAPESRGTQTWKNVLILTHGLNEGSYTKLFLWAYNLAHQLNYPVLIFPISFHMDRRSDLWDYPAQAQLVNIRNRVSGNLRVSPFNARISQRIAQAPQRFLRGGLQSYFDVLDLCDVISSGRHPKFESATTPHFLGYSAGGYLALTLLLSRSDKMHSLSRYILFASCVKPDDMRPSSLFIMDEEAGSKLTTFLKSEDFGAIGLPAGMADKAERPIHWIRHILSGGLCLRQRLEESGTRCLALAGSNDQVLTAAGMEANLAPLPVHRLELGIHEFPFTIDEALPDTFDRRHPSTRAMLTRMRKSRNIALPYQAVFTEFIERVVAFCDGT